MNTPKKFQKKPLVIEAMQLIGTDGDTAEVIYWMDDNLYPLLVGDYTEPETLRYRGQAEGDDSRPDKGCYIDPESGDLMIRTLEGDMRATYGDWIVRGVSGELYPCRPDIFALTYEQVVRDRVAYEIVAEGERMSAVCVACGKVRTTEHDYHPIQVFTGGPFGWFSKDSEEMCPECFTKLMRKANG